MKNKIKFWITPIIFNSVAFSFISSNINEEYTANNSVELNNKIKEMLNKNDQENNNYEFFWAKGIIPPKISDFQIYKHTYDDSKDKLSYIYAPPINVNWFDSNKEFNSELGKDVFLCSAAVTANYLHWFMLNNRDNIQKYYELQFNQNSGKNITKFDTYEKNKGISGFFNYFKNLFSGRLARTEELFNMMINGYNYPNNYVWNENNIDKRGGFFNDVFKNNKLATKTDNFKNVEELGKKVKKSLLDNKALGISFRINDNFGHIVNVWGADFKDGKLSGLYIADSEDSKTDPKQSLVRYNVADIDGKVKISNAYNSKGESIFGSEIFFLHEVDNGRKYFENYFSHFETETNNLISEINSFRQGENSNEFFEDEYWYKKALNEKFIAYLNSLNSIIAEINKEFVTRTSSWISFEILKIKNEIFNQENPLVQKGIRKNLDKVYDNKIKEFSSKILSNSLLNEADIVFLKNTYLQNLKKTDNENEVLLNFNNFKKEVESLVIKKYIEDFINFSKDFINKYKKIDHKLLIDKYKYEISNFVKKIFLNEEFNFKNFIDRTKQDFKNEIIELNNLSIQKENNNIEKNQKSISPVIYLSISTTLILTLLIVVVSWYFVKNKK